uniref:Uncharacterized protein n=1 Tax=Musa acuminata subsp. malaccensis TaxID=214687 RepID=A0A804KLD8_MUSAM
MFIGTQDKMCRLQQNSISFGEAKGYER